MLKLLLPLAVFSVLLAACSNEKKQLTHVTVLLDNTYDSTRTGNDLQFFQSMDEVETVEYISKEKAMEIYLAQGGESWEGVLDENPLPASFEITIKPASISDQTRNAWEERIRNTIHGVESFNWPPGTDSRPGLQ